MAKAQDNAPAESGTNKTGATGGGSDRVSVRRDMRKSAKRKSTSAARRKGRN